MSTNTNSDGQIVENVSGGLTQDQQPPAQRTRKAHDLTGPVRITPSRVQGVPNQIMGDVEIGNSVSDDYSSSLRINSKTTTFNQNATVDFQKSNIQNFVTENNGDIIYQKDGKLQTLSTKGNAGKFLQVQKDELPNYVSIETVLAQYDRGICSIQKTSSQQVFPQLNSVIMGWTKDDDALYSNNDLFDLATGRFTPKILKKYKIVASITFQNTGNIGWRTLSIRKNGTKSVAETTNQAAGDVTIPQTLMVYGNVIGAPGDFFEIVLSHSDNDPVVVLPGTASTLLIEYI